jgi:phage tail protein X
MSKYWALAALVVLAAVAPTQPTQCTPPPGSNGKAPPGYVVYKTHPGDTPYSLAKKFYGHTYLEAEIRKANEKALTKEGFFTPGVDILIPPNPYGTPGDIIEHQIH